MNSTICFNNYLKNLQKQFDLFHQRDFAMGKVHDQHVFIYLKTNHSYNKYFRDHLTPIIPSIK